MPANANNVQTNPTHWVDKHICVLKPESKASDKHKISVASVEAGGRRVPEAVLGPGPAPCRAVQARSLYFFVVVS